MTIPTGIKLTLQFLEKEIRKISARRMVITLDGHSSSGKSTMARQIAELLSYLYVDSGAMYRAVTLYLLRNDIPVDNVSLITEALKEINIQFERKKDGMHTILNGEDVESAIRTMEVSNNVSPVSTVSAVRTFLVEQQRNMAGNEGVVMDGRDIGTVVFPNADVKLFITASIDVRTTRRYDELIKRGTTITREAVCQNLQERDEIDSNRTDSPLKKADDAITIDTSDLAPHEQVQKALEIILKSEQIA